MKRVARSVFLDMQPDVLSLGACLTDDRAVEGIELPRRPEQPLAHLELPHGITQVGERDRLRLPDDLVQVRISRGAARCSAWPCAATVQSGRCSGEGGDTAGEGGQHSFRARSWRSGGSDYETKEEGKIWRRKTQHPKARTHVARTTSTVSQRQSLPHFSRELAHGPHSHSTLVFFSSVRRVYLHLSSSFFWQGLHFRMMSMVTFAFTYLLVGADLVESGPR